MSQKVKLQNKGNYHHFSTHFKNTITLKTKRKKKDFFHQKLRICDVIWENPSHVAKGETAK